MSELLTNFVMRHDPSKLTRLAAMIVTHPAFTLEELSRFSGLTISQICAAVEPLRHFGPLLAALDLHARYEEAVEWETGDPPDVLHADDIWCSDHHVCDVLCWKPNRDADPDGPRTSDTGRFFRPWLTVWQDIRSRKIVGRYFSDTPPTSTNVLLAIRDGITRCGGAPAFAYTDNGKDFDCWMLQGQTKWQRRKYRIFGYGSTDENKSKSLGIYQRLRIQVIHATPYNAKAKPVERWFGFFEQDFGKLQPCYTGRNPQEKPERLDDQLKAGKALTFQEYVDRAAGWIDLIYNASHNHSGHGMNGRTPDVVYAATRGERRVIPADELNACLKIHGDLVKVGSNGVKVGGRIYGQGDPTLAAFFGQRVEVRYDPNDITWASIWSDQGIHLCDVDWNKRAIFGAMKDQEYNQANRTSRRHNKNLREVARRGLQPVTDPTEILLQDAQEQLEKNGKPYTPPDSPADSIKLIRTGLTPRHDEQSQPLRTAVGAESMSPRRGIDWSTFADEEVGGNRQMIDIFSNAGEDL